MVRSMADDERPTSMSVGSPGDQTITLDRTEAAQGLGCWTEFARRLAGRIIELEPDCQRARAFLLSELDAFRTAAQEQTGDPFLAEQAAEFEQVLRAFVNHQTQERRPEKPPGLRTPRSRLGHGWKSRRAPLPVEPDAEE
jgi:hypothetical protein